MRGLLVSSAIHLLMLICRKAVLVSCSSFVMNKDAYHRLRGSASTVLTATGQVNGRWQILTPYIIATPEPIATKFSTIDYVRE